MLKLSGWMLLLIFGPMVLIGLVFIYIGVTASPDALDDSGSQIRNYIYPGAVFFSVSLSAWIGLFIYFKRINDREKYIRNRGTRGTGEILSMDQTGAHINDQPVVIFRLLVTIPGREPYETEIKEILNLLDTGTIREGVKIPVMVHPEKPQYVLLIRDDG